MDEDEDAAILPRNTVGTVGSSAVYTPHYRPPVYSGLPCLCLLDDNGSEGDWETLGAWSVDSVGHALCSVLFPLHAASPSRPSVSPSYAPRHPHSTISPCLRPQSLPDLNGLLLIVFTPSTQHQHCLAPASSPPLLHLHRPHHVHRGVHAQQDPVRL